MKLHINFDAKVHYRKGNVVLIKNDCLVFNLTDILLPPPYVLQGL